MLKRAALALGFLLGAMAGAGPLAPTVAAPRFVPGELLVKFRAEVRADQRLEVESSLGGRTLRHLGLIGAEHLKLGPGLSVEEAVRRLRADPRVEYAEPNYELHADLVPNDPRFPDLYGLRNTGQSGGTPGADIHAVPAWDTYTGDPDMLIGVMDTGIDYTHPDLFDNMWTNGGEIPDNGIDDDDNGYVDDVHGYDLVHGDGNPLDDNGHGTHVAGTLAARGNNVIGVVGVAWGAKLVAIKFLDNLGTGSVAAAVAALDYATAVGARFTCDSWGGGGFSQALLDAINTAGANGQLFIAAAGNSGANTDLTPDYPSSFNTPYIISVAATDANDALASFSNYGATTVDLAAPGANIWSTLPGGNYGQSSGTSMATPLVAGAVALAWGRFPILNNLAIKDVILRSVEVRPALMGKVLTNGRLDLRLAVADRDAIAPGAIGDLAAARPASNGMLLTWTATGDDGSSGRAARYEIRYSTAPITAANFGSATLVAGPDPAPAESAESFEVPGLGFSTRYYFAIRAFDEFDNAGPISNNAIGTTLGAPDVAVAPGSLSSAIPVGTTLTRTLTLTNTAGGTLDFTIPTPVTLASTSVAQPIERLVKGAPDTRVGSPVLESTGGPDPFGYRWADSAEPGGPTFGWVDITGVGTLLPLAGDDATSVRMPMGLTFPFYGTRFDSVFVCTNGFLSFTDQNAPFTNYRLPSQVGVPNMVAPLWFDLHFGVTPRAYTYNDGSRFIVSWINVPGISGEGPYTFQALLYPSGEIRFQYLTLGDPAPVSTVGIQNGAMNVGLTVAFNTPYLRNNMAIRIRPVRQWLTVAPISGRIAAGESQALQVRYDATGLGGGEFFSIINIQSNDPDESLLKVPVRLLASDAPDVAVSPATVGFDSVYVGLSRTRTMTVSNQGTATLVVSGIASSDPTITVAPAAFSLPPTASQDVVVRYAPVVPGKLNATLTLTTNDPDAGSRPVPVTGFALPAPSVVVSPESLSVELATNESTSRTLRITNTGSDDYYFSVHPVRTASQAPATEGAGTARAAAASVEPEAPRPEKGAPDRVFGPAPERAGGPDLFGYTYAADDEPGGPAFQWIDVRSIGTQIPISGDDGVSASLPIGFEFPFYGNVFTTFRMCTNGFVSFTSFRNEWVNTPLPNSGVTTPENLLAVFWDDLDFGLDQRAYYHSDGSRLVIQYQDVPLLNDTPPNTFEIVLTRDGTITYQYLYMRGHFLNSNTIGIQNQARNDGLQVVFNQPYVKDSLAVRFLPPPRFLSVTPETGSIPPGRFIDLSVGFDATDLGGAVYRGALRLEGNDPILPVRNIPCVLTVAGVPDVSTAPPSLDYGLVYIGYPQFRQLQVINSGSDTLEVTGMTSSEPAYGLDRTQLTLPPRSNTLVLVTFTPTVPRDYPGTLTIASNDPDTPSLAVALAGNGQFAPAAHVAPDTLRAALATTLGPTALLGVKRLVIENRGGAELRWRVHPSVSTIPHGVAGAARGVETEALDVQPPKGDPGRPGAPVTENAGGPDELGYTWTDSDEPGEPPFAWIDISASGTEIPFSRDDQNLGPIALPFEFPFYGSAFHSIRVCSNGWLSFTSGDSSYHNWSLPNSGTRVPENLLAPFWDDFDFRRAGRAYYSADPSKFVVAFVGVRGFVQPGGVPPGPYTFEVVLHPSGQIDYQYLDMQGVLNTATIGIQNATKDVGLQVAYNASYVHNNLRVRLMRTPRWLSVSPDSGAVAGGTSDTVLVRFDARGLDDGDHTGVLAIALNDPLAPGLDIPANLHVGVAPASFSVDPEHPLLDLPNGWIPGRLLPPGPCDPEGIAPASLRVAGTVPVASESVRVQGCEGIFEFERVALLSALAEGPEVPVEIMGEVGDRTWFSASDTIRMLRPRLNRPTGPIPGGSFVPLTWTDAAASPPSHYDLWYSDDGGRSWVQVTLGETEHAFAWTAPRAGSTNAYLELVAHADSDNGYVGSGFSGPFVVLPDLTGVADGGPPDRLGLRLAGANPARGGAGLELAIPERGEVEVRVHDLRGALVQRLARGVFEPGRHALRWNGADGQGRPVGPGIYFVRAISRGRVVNLRLALLR